VQKYCTPQGGEEVSNTMQTRPAETRTEIDFLPPFGEPEVVTTGDRAFDVALAGVVVAGGIAYAASN